MIVLKMELIHWFSLILCSYTRLVENAEVTEMYGDYMGCFKHLTSELVVPDLPLVINGTAMAHTVDKCLAACSNNYFRYAGILNGQSCMCGSVYGSQGAGNCTQHCYGNSTQVCGSLQAVSVYATGHLVPGPSKNLTVNQTEETRMGFQWEPPIATNGKITEYKITANVSETYSQMPMTVLSWTYPAAITHVGLLSLNPGTLYNISLTASNEFGPGVATYIPAWTQIREPTQPDNPEVVNKDKGTITVRLKPVINNYGPVSKYRIVVSSEDGVLFANNYLKSWGQAQREGLPYYIAAELDPLDVVNETLFVVGDGKRYGRDPSFYNAPLPAKGEFYVSLGVVSSFQGVTKASYSSPSSHSHHGVILLDVPKGEEGESDGLTTFLKAAIVVCGLLLVGAILVYIVIHRKYGGQRYIRRDQQELNIRGAVTEVENSAFVFDEYLPEEEDRKVDYYDMLHQRIWNIPRNFLDIQPDVVSEGSFGPVYRGSVQRKGQLTPVAVYAIQDGELGSEDKRNMLEGLDVLVRGGDHQNTLSLTGTCESQDTLYIVLENHPATLKDVLLQSRCLQHGEHAKSRFCSLSETQLFEFILGVAQGMNYLASKKIIHKHLTCSNVLMADGVTPKITGFGIAHYSKRNRKQDYTRWSAQEVFTRRIHVTKSDVWSFGVVLWETCALGATPYGELSNGEVAAAVLRGFRLPQLSYLGDTLYQLMLQCWQIDPDERPAFSEILADLHSVSSTAELSMELNFNAYKDFQYETYSSELEYC